MFLGMPLPTWKQIVTRKKGRNRKTYYEELYSDLFLMSESCMSIRLILNAVKEAENKDMVKVLLPDYFCNQTICSFEESWVDIVYYPIKGDMDPDWDYLKTYIKGNEFDVLLFTHYFGKYHGSISKAKEICNNHDSILVEDCAHVLYPTGKIGTSGDFVIYSPHKQLPIMDGAVLVCNQNDQKPVVAEINDWIKARYKNLPLRVGSTSWYIKKSLQKLIPIHRGLTYYPGVHNSNQMGSIHEPKRMSRESYNTLCDFTYLDFKKAAYLRRENLEMMNYILALKYPDIMPLIYNDVDTPYVAVYSLKNVQDKAKITMNLIAEGFTVLYWPDLPYHMNGVDGHEDMKQLSENIIVIPIHQDLDPQKLAKKFLRRDNTGKPQNIN